MERKYTEMLMTLTSPLALYKYQPNLKFFDKNTKLNTLFNNYISQQN